MLYARLNTGRGLKFSPQDWRRAWGFVAWVKYRSNHF